MTRAHVHIPPSAVLMIAGAVACFSVSTESSSRWRCATRCRCWCGRAGASRCWRCCSGSRRRWACGMLRTRQLRMQLLRGCLLVGSSLFFMTALSHLPLADATALNYTTPTIVIVLADRVPGRAADAAADGVRRRRAGRHADDRAAGRRDSSSGTSLFALGSRGLLRRLPDHHADAGGRGSARVAVLSRAGRHADHDLRVAVVRLAHRPDVDRRRAARRPSACWARSATSC